METALTRLCFIRFVLFPDLILEAAAPHVFVHSLIVHSPSTPFPHSISAESTEAA